MMLKKFTPPRIGNLLSRVVNKVKYKGKAVYLDKTAKHVSLPVSELFFQHNGQQDFLRYDMIVRLLAVECYYGQNDYGFDFYQRMQHGRMGKDWADKAVGVFRDLIKSYDKNGYDPHSEILLDSNLHLIDGSHRMAMAMYHSIPTINAKIIDQQVDVFYGIEWFGVNGFSEDECRILKAKYWELHERLMQPFICTLWHPAAPFFEEITEKLKLFGEVVEVKDCQLSEWDYRFYTRGIYAVDDIAKWKIEKKISGMMANNTSNTYRMRMVALRLESPDFRLKATNNRTLSKKCEVIKKVICTYYKERIDNYMHDIILHIGDNFFQNHHIHRLFTMPGIDVQGILQHIHPCNYVVTKTQADYMPKDFPLHYPLGKDIDIICADKAEYAKVKSLLLRDVEPYRTAYRVRAVEKVDGNGEEFRTLLRLELEDHLVFQFDIACRTGRAVAPSFATDMCAHRMERNGFFIPSPHFEVMVRLSELHDHPRKVQHAKYITEHEEDIDEDLCNKYLKFDWKAVGGKEVRN